jgi:TolA-binding protein
MNPRRTTRPSRSSPDDPRRLLADGAETADERRILGLISKLPSAVPTDPAVERVWRRVESAGGSRERATRALTRWWIQGAVAAAVLAVVAWLPSWWNKVAPSSVEVVLSSGGVFSGHGGADWHASASGDALSVAERVRTDPTGRAVLRVRGIAAVLFGKDSEAAVEELGHGTFLRLSRGTLTSRVSKRAPGDPFVIRTDRYTITVVGTLFTVEEGPGAHTAVSVREGVVEVSDTAGHVYRVTAGTRWTSEDTDARGPDRTPDAVKALLESGLQGRSAAEMSTGLASLAPAAAAPTPAPDLPQTASVPVRDVAASPAAATPVAMAPVATAPVTPAPSPPTTPRLGSTSMAPANAPLPVPSIPAGVVSAPPQDAVPTPPAPAPPAALPATAPAVEPTPASVPAASVPAQAPPPAAAIDDGAYTKGIALEAKGDFEGAAQALARAASTDAHRGDLALYSLGRLAQRRLHDPRRALEAFRRYRTEYPQGALLPEVDFAILQIEVEGNHSAEALTESARFLTAHPTSDRAEKVHLVRGNLLRDAGRCGEALADYATIHGADADDAVYSTAYCQRKLGDRAGAASTLRGYLRRFPSGAHRTEAQQAIESENDTDKKY